MQDNRISGVLIFALLTAVVHPVSGLASELGFKGNMLDRPCQVAAESLQQEVVFKTRPAKDFWYSPGYSPAESFSVKLVNCHPSTMGKVVHLTFGGVSEPALPGYLQVGGVNRGRLGIGILDTDGETLLPLGGSHNKGNGTEVTRESVTLTYRARVQATPEAIRNRSVEPGDYDALATFELHYQ